jgi:hypothetical protein
MARIRHLEWSSLRERAYILAKIREEMIVKYRKALVVALSVTVWLPMLAAAEEKAVPPAEKSTTTAKCLVAEVNPVTGHAVCVNPRGAAVESPPASALRPCKPRAHDKEDWTVYERWSGC